MLMTRCQLYSNSTTKWRPCRCYERLEPDTGQFSLTCLSLACVAWRFCRAGRTSGEAREKERGSREKNKTLFQLLPPQSPRGFSALARLYYLATKTAMLSSQVCLNWATFAARFLIYWLKRIPYCTFKLIDTLMICIFSYSFYGNYLLGKEANRCITTKKNNE